MKYSHPILYPKRIALLLSLAFVLSCSPPAEQETVLPVSREDAISKAQEFCNKFSFNCTCSLKPSKFKGLTYLGAQGGYDTLKDFEGTHVVCSEQTALREGLKNTYILFLIPNQTKEIQRYDNRPIYEIYNKKYGRLEKVYYKQYKITKEVWHVYWPEFMLEEKAKKIAYSIAEKLQIPSDMVFERIKKKEGVWNAFWIRKIDGYKYEGDVVIISIMGATGEFVAYTKRYREPPSSTTEMKISREQALEMGWDKFQKYLPWKMKRMGKRARDLYRVSADPLIIQTGVFRQSPEPVNIRGAKLAWVIRYNFTGGFEDPRENLQNYDWTENERKAVDNFDRAMDKKWREFGAPEKYFEVRIDAATGKILYVSPVRPWYVRWFGELTVKR